MAQEYVVLYTKQKTQKAKKWLDGLLRFNVNNKKVCNREIGELDRRLQATLWDENGRTALDSKFLSRTDSLDNGETIEFELHLVMIEHARAGNDHGETASQNDATSTPQPDPMALNARPSHFLAGLGPLTSQAQASTRVGNPAGTVAARNRDMRPYTTLYGTYLLVQPVWF